MNIKVDIFFYIHFMNKKCSIIKDLMYFDFYITCFIYIEASQTSTDCNRKICLFRDNNHF